MERDYGQEMIHVFSKRLKLAFGLPEPALSTQIALSLERLRRREAEGPASAESGTLEPGRKGPGREKGS